MPRPVGTAMGRARGEGRLGVPQYPRLAGGSPQRPVLSRRRSVEVPEAVVVVVAGGSSRQSRSPHYFLSSEVVLKALVASRYS